MKKQIEEAIKSTLVVENKESIKHAVDKILLAINNKLNEGKKARLASKWSKERSEGDRQQDRECYYDYLMGIEEAIRQITT